MPLSNKCLWGDQNTLHYNNTQVLHKLTQKSFITFANLILKIVIRKQKFLLSLDWAIVQIQHFKIAVKIVIFLKMVPLRNKCLLGDQNTLHYNNTQVLHELTQKKFYNICHCSFDPEKRNPKTKIYTQFWFINCSD